MTALITAHRYDRIAGTEDPAVHHRGNRLLRRAPEGGPEIAGVGVGEAVRAQVVANAFAERHGAEILLEHPQHRGALLVRQHVEHRVRVAWRGDRKLDRPRAVQAVERQRGRARHAERRPALPLGFPRVDGQHLHERRERLVEPDAVPPRHRHEVAEPHVRVLVGHHVGHALELGVRRRRLVHQQRRLAERDRAEILHGARGEIRDRYEIQLVAGVRQTVVVLEERQRGGADLLTEPRQSLLARHAPDLKARASDRGGLRRLELADDERDQVGGHDDAVGEANHLAAVLERLRHDRGVRHGGQRRIDGQRHRENRLERGLVPARKRAPRVGGLELRGGHGARHTAGILVDGAIEPAQLVVERAAKRQAKPPAPARGGRGEGEPTPLGALVERGRGADRLAAVVLEARGVDHELDRIEDDLGDRLRHLEGDGLLTAKGERREIGLESNVVTGRHSRPGQTIGIHGSSALGWPLPR